MSSLLCLQKMILQLVHRFHEGLLQIHIVYLCQHDYRPQTVRELRPNLFEAVGNLSLSMRGLHKFYEIVDISEKAFCNVFISGG